MRFDKSGATRGTWESLASANTPCMRPTGARPSLASGALALEVSSLQFRASSFQNLIEKLRSDEDRNPE